MVEQTTLKIIIQRISDGFHPEKIILFGSYVDGSATADSDIDLLIVADTDLSPIERFSAVSRILAEFPIAFDIIVKTPAEYNRWRDVVNHIVYFADKYGKTVYEQ
ncbi:nucleotidyltransferase domain-containing protein [bacterium]|nr:nucleotidyltransferase domain-containing protein [bacterium]